MGNIVSKKEPVGVKPRDPQRVLAASQHIAPIRDQLIALNDKLQGKVLLAPTDESELVGGTDDADAYHQQRERAWFFNDCQYPSAIVMCESPEDVAQMIQFMASLNNNGNKDQYQLCVAGGCHSHFCLVEHSIVVDLSRLDKVTVDTSAKTITIAGGCKIEQAHAALKGTGLSFATGTNGDTGISGLTLAGGAGYLGGQAGFACDTVVSAQVVLPSGKIVTATDDNEYKDLMRALRGGGGNFGVVTDWTFQLFDVSNAFGGTVVHLAPTVARAKTVLDNFGKAMEEMPDAGCALLALPTGAPVVVTLATMIGDEVKDAKSFTEVPFLNQIANLGGWIKLSNDLGRKDYITQIASMLEPVQTRTYGTVLGAMVYAFDDAIREALVHFTRVDVPTAKNTKAIIILQSISGEMRRNDGSKSSIRHRKAVGWILFEGAYEPHATEDQIKNLFEWQKRAKQRILELGGEDGPHNFCDSDGRQIKFFTDEQRTFLQQAKKKYDPENLFRLNKEIYAQIE